MTPTSYYCIGGHALAVTYVDPSAGDALIPSFAPFRLEQEPQQLLFAIRVCPELDRTETADEIGQFDCGGCNHGVYKMPDGGYCFEIHDVHGVLCCRMQSNADFTRCSATILGETWQQRNYGLNNALMLTYAFASSTSMTLLMHASVIRHNGKGYLMTAPSGTGKSTHTRLWYDNIPGCDLMNDDNPVVRIIGQEAIVYGTPWSGKTRCYRNIQAPIGGLVRILQRPENSIRSLSPLEAFCQLLPAMSTMKWDKRVHDGVCDTIGLLIRLVGMHELGCLPNAEAAILCHDTIAK